MRPKFTTINLLLILACGLGAGCPTEKPRPQKNGPLAKEPAPPAANDAGGTTTPVLDSGLHVSPSQDAGASTGAPADAGGEPAPALDGGWVATVDAGVTLSAEAVQAAGKYLTAYQYMREAIMWGATDPEYDLDGDNALGILDVIAARCLAHTQSNGILFPQMEVGCPVQADVTKFGALIPATTTECVVDDDCQGASPGSPRCVVTEASCRCLPIGASGLSECQPTFP